MPEQLLGELIEKRTENSKTHFLGVQPDGKHRFSYDTKIGAIHYKDNYEDAKEQWKDIDTTIQEIDGKLVVNKAPYGLEIFKDKIGFKDVSKKGGWVEVVMKGVPTVPTPIIQANKAIFEDVLPFVDVIVEAQPTRIVIWKKIKKDIPRQFKYDIKESKGKRNPVVLGRINSFDDAQNEVQTKLSKTKISETADYVVSERMEDVFSKAIKDDKEIKPVFPVMLDVVVDEQVGASSDDVYRYINPAGTKYFFDTSLQLVVGTIFDNIYDMSVRFDAVPIPQGATIDVAYLTFRAHSSKSATVVNTNISGENAGNPNFITGYDDYTNRSKTTAVTWDGVGAWTADTDYNSPSIVDVVQTIINRADFASGNAINIFWMDDGSTGSGERWSYSYDGSSTYAPKLHVEYSVAAGAIMNQLQKANLGADLFNGGLIV